ncbi:MAG: phosphoribosyltransferase family protein [Bacteroidota bacterium]
MASKKIKILDNSQVQQVLKRIAYQIYENNFREKELIIAGIDGNGYIVAGMIEEQLKLICKLKITRIKTSIDKKNPSEKTMKLSDLGLKLEGKNILVVDDVLNTGKTMAYALLPFLKGNAKQIHTAVLVDRDHKNFPVRADFIGISLSTTLQDHVDVVIDKKTISVYLN